MLAGNFLRQKQLPANADARLKQGHAVAALCGLAGAGEACGACAQHGNLDRFFSLLDRPLPLTAGAGVDQAADWLAREDAVQTCLIAGNAGIDGAALPRLRFAHKSRVGQKRAGHGHHVGVTLSDEIVRHFGGVDAVAGHHGHAHRLLELLRGPAEGRAGHHHGNGGYAGLVPAHAGVENVYACGFKLAGQVKHFQPVAAMLDQIHQRQAKADDKVLRQGCANALHDAQRKAAAALGITAPAILTEVGDRGQKLVDQIALATHDFHAVVARIFGQQRAAHMVGNDLLDLLMAQLQRAAVAELGDHAAG